MGDNTQWGAVLAQFLTGFTAGYYGQAGQSLNPQLTGTVSLDQNDNWNPTYAFHNDTDTIASAGTGYNFDPYAQVFYDDSNSYGSPYTDALMSQYTSGGPLLDVADSSGTDASTLDLTIFGQGETPSGYTTPTIYDYIAPTGTAGYAIPESNASGANLTFEFYARAGVNAGISLNPDATISVSLLVSDADNTPVWQTVTIAGTGTYAAVGDPDLSTVTDPGLWNLWTIENVGGIWKLAVNVTGSGQLISQPEGSLGLNLPTANSAASNVSWYQITVSDSNGGDAKTYNLYTTTNSSGGFLNPAYDGQAGSQAIDGLASVSGQAAGPQYVPSLTLNFSNGDTVTYNPNLVVENTGSNSNLAASDGFPTTLPAPPVAVIDQGGTLSALTGSVITPGTYSNTPTIAGTVTSTVGEMQFGWAGYDTNDVTVSETVSVTDEGTQTITGYGWTGSAVVDENLPEGGTLLSTGSISNIGGYTDKTNPWDDAVVIVHNSVSGDTTITAQADVDGNWLTEDVKFGVGAYTLTMYDAVDTNGTLTPVTGQSDDLILNVETAANGMADNEVQLACFAAGTRIATPGGLVAVEDLLAGDTVLTADGRCETIRWIGHRTVDCARHPNPMAVWPVRIAAGAFGPQMPVRDLFLSPDHAIYAEGVLVPVKHLINGGNVAQVWVANVTYFHVEVTGHDVLLAEGLAAESYLDTGDRRSFANGSRVVSLHPAWGSEARDIALFMEAEGYAPLTVTGPLVAALRARLAARLAEIDAA